MPGEPALELEHLVLDVNGTLTDRGEPIECAVAVLARLQARLSVHLLSADTFCTAEALASRLGAVYLRIVTGADKAEYVRALGAHRCVAIGNGRNDAAMLEAAALGIAVVGPEGLHRSALIAADVTALSIAEALELLASPRSLTATLRW